MSASEDFQASNGMDDLPDFPPEFPGCEIQVHENDVLNGRGINIAQHPGNERFRALIQARFDPLYCTKYSPGTISHTMLLQAAAKKVIAMEIVQHIHGLDPPGRFLRRVGRGNKGRTGGDDQWEELSAKESLKKTTQALRDCNRPDRSGYAADVPVLPDVQEFSDKIHVMGFSSQQEYAEELAKAEDESMLLGTSSHKREAEAPVSPFQNPFENPPSPKRVKLFETPATVASSGIPDSAESLQLLGDDDLTQPAPDDVDGDHHADLAGSIFGDDLFFS